MDPGIIPTITAGLGLAQTGILAAIFLRLGRVQARTNALRERVDRLTQRLKAAEKEQR